MRTSMATMNSHSIEKNGRVAILFIIVFAILLEKAACRRCEHSLKSETGYFGRGDFIDRYQNAAKCTWKIETSSGSRIKLILRLFDDNCTVNYIAVYDGPSTEDKLLGKFCGKHTSPVIITTTNKMFVLSHSDTSPGNGGFQAFYSTECNHLLNTTDGNITSPNYPNPYPDAQLCTYQLQTTPGKRIKLYFDDFNLESDNSCWFDFVAIYDGATTNDTLLGKYCGDSQLSPLVSTSHRMLMVFHADASRTGTGFRAHYSSEPASNNSHMEISSSLSDVDGKNEDYTEETAPGCEHSIKSETGYFGTPDFIDRYRNAAKCIWKIETSSGSRIKLILRLFDDNCTVNYLAVYDGPSTKGKLLGEFCGKKTSPFIITTTNKMFVVSHSDTSPENRGFQAFYSTECNHLLNTTDGNITSPNYPNPYPDAQLCTYQLQTTPGKRIKLYFDDFNLESDNSCWFDFVAIYDGATTNDTLLGKYCGDSQLSPLVSTSHRMLMVFHADASRTGTGFRAHYSSASNNSHMEISSSLSDVDGNNEGYTEQTSPGI